MILNFIDQADGSNREWTNFDFGKYHDGKCQKVNNLVAFIRRVNRVKVNVQINAII